MDNIDKMAEETEESFFINFEKSIQDDTFFEIFGGFRDLPRAKYFYKYFVIPTRVFIFY